MLHSGRGERGESCSGVDQRRNATGASALVRGESFSASVVLGVVLARAAALCVHYMKSYVDALAAAETEEELSAACQAWIK